jgi:hypothetical protein
MYFTKVITASFSVPSGSPYIILSYYQCYINSADDVFLNIPRTLNQFYFIFCELFDDAFSA